MNKKGFTLTELIVVIVIIGLVLLIVIPVSSNIIQNNAEEKGKFYVQTLENAVNTYCDMYKTDVVTFGQLTSEGLFKKESSNGVSTDLTKATFKRDPDGTVKFNNKELGIFIILCGTSKFLLDFLRIKTTSNIFSTNQLLSLVFIFIGIFIFIKYLKEEND